jgi:pimeloyl-ACP methyl ester carboxylesterase
VENPRCYGAPPYTVALIHGGPGAPGTMAPVARELAAITGVVEPLQTAASLKGQVLELRDALQSHADPPVVLIGSSWGAMLSFVVTARFPELVRKLILVGSGVFEARYAPGIAAERDRRLTAEDRDEIERLTAKLSGTDDLTKSAAFSNLGHIYTKIDAFDPLTLDTEMIEAQFDVYESAWGEMERFRASGEFLALGGRIRCPVVAIHGDYDPHPIEGVRDPLSRVLPDFRFILLDQCGHLPWIERHARDEFYRVLKEEIAT